MATVKRLNKYRHCITKFGPLNRSLSCVPTGSALGAYIYDFDFAETVNLQTKNDLNRLLLQHQLLIFRNKDNNILSDQTQVEFTRIFGDPKPHTRKNSVYNSEYPEIFIISNVDKFGNHLGCDYLPWHADLSYLKEEHIGTIAVLRAVELNNINSSEESDESDDESDEIGHTLFMNCYETYNKLPLAIKNGLMDYVGMHRHPIETQNPDDTLVYHPVIRYHSVTQKPVLYVSPHFTRYIVKKENKSKAESGALDDILDWLFDHSSDRQFVHQHNWEVGDVLVWDNECTQHSRVAFDGDNYKRVMKRTQIYGANSRLISLMQ